MSLLFCSGYNVPTPFVEATMSLFFCSGYNVPAPFVVATMSLHLLYKERVGTLKPNKKSRDSVTNTKGVGTLKQQKKG
jgi:hypothetical protein